jgi:arginine decarboxylase
MTWSTADSAELYGVAHWGKRLFAIDERGHLVAEPLGPGKGRIDLLELVHTAAEADLELPLLVRMPQVAERRLRLLVQAFEAAKAEYGFCGRHRGVYPIKVNQQRELVEGLLSAGRPHGFGLEAGSKAELLVATAMLDDPDALLLCNGYKDRGFMDAALRAQLLGRETIVVLEKRGELKLLLDSARAHGVRPNIGVRARLSSPGKGRWSSSAGDRAKFGLSAQGIVEVVEELRAAGFLDCLRLLHFHVGSQVTSVRTITRAVREAARLYTELVRLGAPMGLLDVGGGLAVDYDGSRTDFESSRNYTVKEYARTVVAEVVDACDRAELPHPDLVTESGRATVAHCAVLLMEVLGAERAPTDGPLDEPREGESSLLGELRTAWEHLNERNYQEIWHDINDVRHRSRHAFDHGSLSLVDLAAVQRAYWQLCGRLNTIARRQRYLPDDLEALQEQLADTYYANVSVFQSLPDSWALDQLFPVLPIHRLDERPTRRAVIADVTCDSDGKISRFVDLRDVKHMLELHALRPDEPYVLAVPLVGAYQEILGGLHNLFGPTHAVHVSVDEDGGTSIDTARPGVAIDDAVRLVDYDPGTLLQRLAGKASACVEAGTLEPNQAEAVLGGFRDAFGAYTYLSRSGRSPGPRGR